MDFREYAQAFDEAERDFMHAVGRFGLGFEAKESSPRSDRARVAEACGCHCENADSSLWGTWISPACLACRTGERTATFFIDLKCTRSCYFCFNPNQDGYEHFLSHKRDIAGELAAAYRAGASFDCLAVTGGEPLLYPDEVISFLDCACELYPDAHVRLYTCGDPLDDALLERLSAAGLDEIRFSIKPESLADGANRVYRLMEKAASCIPAVMVELPAIPGTLDDMKEMLRLADAAGAKGVNILEFCFPLCNAGEYERRGFALRRHPFDHLYNYWYGGGIPVARSESEALELLRFAREEGLSLGVHYCSSDNKNTGQIYQQNKPFSQDEAIRKRYPWLDFDDESRFLVCVKAFGRDAEPVRRWLAEGARAKAAPGAPASGGAAAAGAECGAAIPFSFDRTIPSVSFPIALAAAAKEAFPQAELGKSYVVLEEDESGCRSAREVSVRRLG